MANTLSVDKSARAAETRRRHNASQRSAMRAAMKKVTQACESGDSDRARESFRHAVKVLATAAGKRLITKNKAARHMSRLNRLVRGVSQGA